MRRNTIISILLVTLIIPARGLERERIKEFILKKPLALIANSLYNEIELIDQRKDKDKMGRVDYSVMAIPPLSVQLADYMKNITDSSARSGKLVLCLKNFKFSQRSAVMGVRRV
ncbi:MAG: hypothetical protein PHS84_04805, partial [Paludibacter sp.]|nr:hypothetical protein [Paludibacter sp.]